MSTKEYLKITTSFPEGWEKEYLYAEKQSNTSLYIRDLIREDILKEKRKNDDTQKEILKILKKLSSGNKMLEINNDKPSDVKKEALKIIMKSRRA